jgi:hypothetical protein
MDLGLNIRPVTMQLLQEHINKLHDIRLHKDFLTKTMKAQATKVNIEKQF